MKIQPGGKPCANVQDTLGFEIRIDEVRGVKNDAVIRTQITFTALPDVNRAGQLDDAFFLIVSKRSREPRFPGREG